MTDLILETGKVQKANYFNVYKTLSGRMYFGKFSADKGCLLAVPDEERLGTYKYLDGDITKVEESSNAD